MKDNLMMFFVVAGITFVTLIVIIGIIYVIIYAFKFINFIEYRHYVKHRFDKEPLAKCYCADCEHYDSLGTWEVSGRKYGRCRKHSFGKINDDFYCKEAEVCVAKADTNKHHFNEKDLASVRFKSARLMSVKKSEEES